MSIEDVRLKTQDKKEEFENNGNWDSVFAFTNGLIDIERTQGTVKILHKSETFKDMESIIMKTHFPQHAETVYMSRFAAALALDGELDGALVYAKRSLDYIDLEKPCRANANVIYALINVLLRQYARDKKLRTKGEICAWIKTGRKQVENLESKQEDVHVMWTRMLLMKEVFVHLGIELSSKEIAGVKVNDKSIKKAKECLKTLRESRYWKGIDQRRKMLFYRSIARITSLEGKDRNSLLHLRHALKIARRGNFQSEIQTLQDEIIVFRNVE